MEHTQVELSEYLGTWRYQDGKTTKYWRVLPSDNTFTISWGRTLLELDAVKTPNKTVIEDSGECYKRILSKARGGYVIYKRIGSSLLTPKCHDTYDAISEVLASEQSESRKRKPRTRKLSLCEWMSGMEETRENETI